MNLMSTTSAWGVRG